MNNIGNFTGAGIYIIYYRGGLKDSDDPYRPLSEENAKDFVKPIYVGKAIPKGGRIGGFRDESAKSSALSSRLRKHANKIKGTSLDINYFFFRYLALDDVFIPLGENVIIDKYRPLWNVAVSGFGNNPLGAGRENQKPSRWDVLHPVKGYEDKIRSRKGAPKLSDVLSKVQDYFAGKSFPVILEDGSDEENEE